MTQVVVPNSAQVRLLWALSNGVGTQINVLGAIKPSGTVINQTLANTLGAAIKSALASSGLLPLIHPTNSLTAIGVRDTSTAQMPEFLDTGAAVVGTAPAADALPRGVALVVTLRTGRAGPSFRGRVYLGGFTETENIGGGGPSTALQTAAPAFVSAVQSAMTASGLTLAVMSRPANATSTTEIITNPDGSTTTRQRQTKARPGAVTQVTAVQLRNAIWDSQRRRTAPGSMSTFALRPLISHDLESGDVVTLQPIEPRVARGAH